MKSKEKSCRNFSEKNINYYRKATNTLDPRLLDSSNSKGNKKIKFKKQNLKASNLDSVVIKIISSLLYNRYLSKNINRRKILIKNFEIIILV